MTNQLKPDCEQINSISDVHVHLKKKRVPHSYLLRIRIHASIYWRRKLNAEYQWDDVTTTDSNQQVEFLTDIVQYTDIALMHT